MKKTKELVKKLNEFRDESFRLHKTFTGAELQGKLKELGFNSTVASKIATSWFPFEVFNHGRLYEAPKNPIPEVFLIDLYKRISFSVKKNKKNREQEPKATVITTSVMMTEEQMIEHLKETGKYQIKSVVGFDLERFQKENPVLYEKYLKYEII